MNIETRQKIERQIVTKVVEDALASGYMLNVDNGGDTYELLFPSKLKAVVLGAMFATDSEQLVFFQDNNYKGAVWLVYGNDGTDVIADYSVSLDKVLEGAFALVNELEEQHS